MKRFYRIEKLDQVDGFTATWVVDRDQVTPEQIGAVLIELSNLGYRLGETMRVMPETVH